MDWIRAELTQVKPMEMMRALCRNAVNRKTLLGQVHGVTLAFRRRDNALRINLTPEQVRQVVGKPVSQDMVQEENLTLLYIRQQSFCK